ncbi:MAG TPA: outer membrane beta-barrel protein [Vicinamibacterales bacterium]|nr:outer membrane beta-barrel protein [Vicinamibacterales bacterium]
MLTRLTTPLAAAGVLILAALPAAAQDTDRDAEIRRRIAVLEQQLAELKALVDERRPAAPQATVSRDQLIADDSLHGLQFGAALDTYYDYNFNQPIGRVNLLRAYDVTSNNFSLNQANLIVESPPNLDAGRRLGGRLDLQYGQATETLQGSGVNEPRPQVYRNIFQAYGTYVFPVGRGLTLDFGKWASALGFENNYVKDQINYSRSYWFNFLPFYHTGARVNYKINDGIALNYWITNGTQQTEAFNNFKDQLAGVVLQPAQSVTWSVQYYLGQEHRDVEPALNPGLPTIPTQPGLSITPVVPYFPGKLHIFDTYATWQASPRTTIGVEGDWVLSRSQPPAADSRVYGGAVYAKRQLTDKTALAGRAEFMRDHGGLFSGVTQSLKETTVTYDYRPAADGFLIRAEWRRDFSDTPFFLTDTAGSVKDDQQTATLGLVWWWGNKRQAW